MKNEGKIFEQCFQKSIPDNILVKRFNDNAASFGGSVNTRFSSTNECDYELFDPESRTLYFLELKSSLNSLTFWRDDFEEKGKKQTFMIKKHQIKGLSDSIKYQNIVAGLVLNFRNKENTYFWNINDFLEFSNNTDKKSFNEDDVIMHNGYLINQTKKIKHYIYEIDNFVNDMTN